MAKLSVTITRNYGPFSFAWSMEDTPELLETRGDMHTEYDKLYKRLYAEIDKFEREQLGDLSIRWGAPSPGAGTSAQSEQWYTIDKLYWKVDGDKRMLRVTTKEPNFAKWGVAVYQEVIDQFALAQYMGESTSKEALQGRVKVSTINGKSKAVEFEGLF